MILESFSIAPLRYLHTYTNVYNLRLPQFIKIFIRLDVVGVSVKAVLLYSIADISYLHMYVCRCVGMQSRKSSLGGVCWRKDF